MNGWLAGALSLGDPARVPVALMVLSLAGLALGAWAVSRLCLRLGATPCGGLVIAVSPGLLFAAASSTTETMGIALVVLLVLAWSRSAPPVVLAIMSVLVCLYREQYVIVVAGILLFEAVLAARRRRLPDADDWRRAAALLVGVLFMVLWHVTLFRYFGEWPRPSESGNLAFPVLGWLETFNVAKQLSAWDAGNSQIGSTAPAYLIALATLLIVAGVRALRLRSPLDAILLLQVLLMSMLAWTTLVFPHEWFRIPVLSVLLALGVLLIPRPNGSRTQRNDQGVSISR